MAHTIFINMNLLLIGTSFHIFVLYFTLYVLDLFFSIQFFDKRLRWLYSTLSRLSSSFRVASVGLHSWRRWTAPSYFYLGLQISSFFGITIIHGSRYPAGTIRLSGVDGGDSINRSSLLFSMLFSYDAFLGLNHLAIFSHHLGFFPRGAWRGH